MYQHESEKERHMGTHSSTGSFVKGFVIGGAIGAVAALLWAPQSGEDTRSQIQEKGIELKEKAAATYADVQERVETTTADLRNRMDELSTKVDQMVAQVKEGPIQRTAGLAEESAPEKEPTVKGAIDAEAPVVS
jgi:gas vesicle protein